MHEYRLPAVSSTYPPEETEGELTPYAHRDIKPAYAIDSVGR